ncbi:MAG TPA: polymer-forming cytoskeletal protein [Bryobacteraceae bacterium]|nr:polymer-forming cytoskeletal protein [Bryobacteraceae bacterium]
MASTPQGMPEPESQNGTTIGNAVKIVGRVFTKGDLCVDGDIEGTIESQESNITIGPGARVQASIHALRVVILGQVQGNVEASVKVDLRKDAKLVGDINSSRVSIEEGAFFKGRINTVDTRKPAPKTLAAVPA